MKLGLVWRRFLKSWLAGLFLLGLLLVLCMGCPAGMVLLVAMEKAPLLFWAAAALAPAIPALIWTARKGPRSTAKEQGRDF